MTSTQDVRSNVPTWSETQRILRLTGIAGIVAALCWTLGDALLLGAKATADDYPILLKYAGSGGFASQVVQSGVQFFGSSPERLAAGALIPVLTTPLYLASVWHIYLALRPAGKWPSVGPLLLLGAGYSFAPFVHGSFYYIAELVKLLPVVDEPAQTHVLEAATRATTVLFGTVRRSRVGHARRLCVDDRDRGPGKVAVSALGRYRQSNRDDDHWLSAGSISAISALALAGRRRPESWNAVLLHAIARSPLAASGSARRIRMAGEEEVYAVFSPGDASYPATPRRTWNPGACLRH